MPRVQDVLTAIARIAFQRSERGDLRELDPAIQQLSGAVVPEHRAWRLGLQAIQWSFEPARRGVPSLTDVAALAGEGAPVVEPLVEVCAVMERVALGMFDGPALKAWADLHASLLETVAGSTGPEPRLAVARLWQRILRGESADLDVQAGVIVERASRTSAGSAAIQGTVIRALSALSEGKVDEAVELARRGSRMAQAESLSHDEYLANIVLARVRRYSGRPHLALHILAALDRVAPASWSGWIGWETLLAGGSRPAPTDPASAVPSSRAERALGDVLRAARAGDREAFRAALPELKSSAGVWPGLATEAAALIAGLDPLEVDVPIGLQDWCSGQTALIPFGLHGVSVSPAVDPQVETATAYVLGRPGKLGRRFLLPGLALIPGARVVARDPEHTPGRTETGIAALVLAGEAGESRDDFFRSVYGFTFVPYRHRGVLDTLCHRMRALLGEAGEIRREEESPSSAIALALREAIVVPDMRCVLPTADRVLRSLALVGPTSATAAAESLRMPLRTVQLVLQQLVAEGACAIERSGRRVAYRIQDTTFTAVTVA